MTDSWFEDPLLEAQWSPVEEGLAVQALQRRMFGGSTEDVCVGRYVLRERLARGGMGVVYRALDPNLGREVALKLIRTERDSEEARRDLLAEARALAAVSHPNVVEVYDSGRYEADGEAGVFLVMALLRGPTLLDWMGRRPRSWRAAMAAFLDAGEGLAAIHRAGLVHRDFKASNVVMGDPVQLIDFGLATRSSETAVAGTPPFMAPEQVRGECGPRSDQYSFCASLWVALHGASIPESPRRAASDWQVPPNSRVPRWLRTVLRRGLEADPNHRHPDMDSLLAALRRDTVRTARRTALTSAVIAVTGVGGYLAGSPLDPRCVGSPMQEDWTPDARARIRDRFEQVAPHAAASAFEHAQGAIDAYVEAALDVRTEVCGWAPSREREHALSCLRRDEVRARVVIDVLEAAEADVVARSWSIADRLPRSEQCALEAPAPPAPPLEAVDRASVLSSFGRRAEALVALDEATRAAKTDGHRASIAAVRCNLAARTGIAAQLIEPCRVSWLAAERAGDDALAASALATLAEGTADAGRLDEAWDLLQLAEAKHHASPSPSRQVRLLEVRANLVAETDPQQAIALFESSIEQTEAMDGPGSTRAMGSRVSLATIYHETARVEAARALLEDAIERVESRQGPNHPTLAALHNNLGFLELDADRLNEADAHLSEALRLKNRAPVPNPLHTVTTLGNLALVDDLRGDYALAEAHARQAGRARDDDGGYLLAQVLRHQGRVEEASALAEATWGRLHDAEELSERLSSATEYARALLELGDAEQARTVLLQVEPSPDMEPWVELERREYFAVLAMAEATLLDRDAALSALDRAVRVHDGHPLRVSQWALTRLELAQHLHPIAPQQAVSLENDARLQLLTSVPHHPVLHR